MNSKITFLLAFFAVMSQSDANACLNNSAITSALVNSSPAQDTINCGTITINAPDAANAAAIFHDATAGTNTFNLLNSSDLSITNSSNEIFGLKSNYTVNITNTGDINLETTSPSKNTNGIYAIRTSGLIHNSGNITINSAGSATGIMTAVGNYEILNDGNINITAAGNGAKAINNNFAGTNVTNNGLISINGSGATGIYGGNSMSGYLLNTGNIDVDGDSARGIQANVITGYLTNQADISLINTNGYGIAIDALQTGLVTNDGDISITGGGEGFRLNQTAGFTNTGKIDISGGSGTNYGVYINSDSGEIINNGAITINNSSIAYGMEGYQSSNITNNANITVSASSTAKGISVGSPELITNNADISVYSVGANAHGINTESSARAINNTGHTISATSDDGEAAAIRFTNTNGDDYIINNGNLVSNTKFGYSYGIYKETSNNSDITNNGNITSTSTDDDAFGIYVLSVVGQDVINTGNINVSSGSANAYGIYTDTASGNISTTKEITSTGYNIGAYYNSNVNISNYAIEFDGDQSAIDTKHEGKIAHDNTSIVNFTGSNLTAYTGNNFVSGQVYDLPTLVRNTDSGLLAANSDQFATANIITSNPDYTYNLINKAGAAKQQLKIDFTPSSTTPKASSEVNNLVNQINAKSIRHDIKKIILPKISGSKHSTPDSNIGLGFADNKLVQTDALASFKSPNNSSEVRKIDNQYVFVLPYFSTTNDNSAPVGYNAKTTGITTGVSFMPQANTIIGFHVGYGNSNIDFEGTGYDQRNKISHNYMMGAQAAKLFNNNILVSGTSTFTHIDNKYKDSLSTNRETGNYNSRSLSSDIEVGYVKDYDSLTVIPKVGLNHYWFNADKYTTNNLDNANTTFGSVNDHSVSALIGVETYNNYTKGEWTIRPAFNASIERVLTDASLESRITAGNASGISKSSQHKTSFNLGTNIALEKENQTFTLGYDTHLIKDSKSHNFFVELKHKF